jgi:dihydroxyacid dehydratase/phosphogluconate dehydratase
MLLRQLDGVDAEEVIFSPERARARGLTSTMVFPRGNLAPEGSVVKSTALDPAVVDADGVYRKEGPARVFVNEKDAMAAIKQGRIQAGDVMVLTGIGPLGTGMEETYQVTAALKHLPFGKHVALLTDARFSGVSTGACIGHIGPEGWRAAPSAKWWTAISSEFILTAIGLEGTVDLVGEEDGRFTPEAGDRILAGRTPRPDLAPHAALPEDTRLWAALQSASGGTWAGCVYDADRIIAALEAGRALWLNPSLMMSWKGLSPCANAGGWSFSPPKFTGASMAFGITARWARNSNATSRITGGAS